MCERSCAQQCVHRHACGIREPVRRALTGLGFRLSSTRSPQAQPGNPQVGGPRAQEPTGPAAGALRAAGAALGERRGQRQRLGAGRRQPTLHARGRGAPQQAQHRAAPVTPGLACRRGGCAALPLIALGVHCHVMQHSFGHGDGICSMMKAVQSWPTSCFQQNRVEQERDLARLHHGGLLACSGLWSGYRVIVTDSGSPRALLAMSTPSRRAGEAAPQPPRRRDRRSKWDAGPPAGGGAGLPAPPPLHKEAPSLADAPPLPQPPEPPPLLLPLPPPPLPAVAQPLPCPSPLPPQAAPGGQAPHLAAVAPV